VPLFENPWIFTSALFYLVAVVAIGAWASRRTRNPRDFFIAGQSLGVVVTGFATMSAAFSGFVFLGGPGLTYRLGVASLFICLPVGLTAGMLGWTLARPLRQLAGAREVLTVPDAIFERYRSRAASGLAAVAIVVGSVGYLGAQLLALGVVIEQVFDLSTLLGTASLPAAVGLGLLVVLFYAAAGGMVAGVYTDLLQGVLMAGAAVAVFGYALSAGGGPAQIARDVASSDAFGPAFLDPLGNVPVMMAAGFFFVFAVGPLGQPHMLHKFFMLRDLRDLRWLPLVLGGSQALCVLIWLGIGLAVPALVAGGRLAPLANTDEAAPAFLLGFVPEALAGLVFASILAAIMSTADSFVNVASAALVRDLPRAFGRRLERELLWGRVAVVGVALLASALALVYGDLIALLGTFAFGTFAAALAPALAVGMNWRRVTASAAVASIAVGMGLNLVLEFLARQSFFPALPRLTIFEPGVLPTAVALAASFTTLFAVTWWTGRKGTEELDEDIAAVLEL